MDIWLLTIYTTLTDISQGKVIVQCQHYIQYSSPFDDNTTKHYYVGDEEKPMVKKPHTNHSESGLSSLGVRLVSTIGNDSPNVDALS